MICAYFYTVMLLSIGLWPMSTNLDHMAHKHRPCMIVVWTSLNLGLHMSDSFTEPDSPLLLQLNSCMTDEGAKIAFPTLMWCWYKMPCKTDCVPVHCWSNAFDSVDSRFSGAISICCLCRLHSASTAMGVKW